MRELYQQGTKPRNYLWLEFRFEKDSQNEMVLFADTEGKGLDLTFDLARGIGLQSIVNQTGGQYAQGLCFMSRSCSIANQATTANIFIDNSIFEIFINKGDKVFSGRVYPHADQNGILIKSGTRLELTTNLIMVAKLHDVVPNSPVSALLLSHGSSIKKDTCLKNDPKVQEAMRELGYKPNNVARSLQGKISQVSRQSFQTSAMFSMLN